MTALVRLCAAGFLAYCSYDVGDALGPIAAGLLVASLGYARMFQVVAASAGMVTIAFWLLSREPGRRWKEEGGSCA